MATTIRGTIAALCLAVAVIVVSSSPVRATPAAVVIDGNTGAVLYQNNINHRHYPASLTKMMTLYLLFEAIDRG
ncbi:MAG: D-alanyl-D-alanine carboxypeptidase, partial [Alphaproteobacteria bacterium]